MLFEKMEAFTHFACDKSLIVIVVYEQIFEVEILPTFLLSHNQVFMEVL